MTRNTNAPKTGSIEEARLRVASAMFGEQVATDFVGKIKLGNTLPEDAADCISDVREILSGGNGQDAIDAFVAELRKRMVGKAQPSRRERK